MKRARDFTDPETGRLVREKEYAIAPRYTPKWMRIAGDRREEIAWPKVIGFDKKVAGYVVAAGEEPDVVQINFPALDNLEAFLSVRGYGRGYMPPGNEWIDKQTLHWRNQLLTPKSTATGYRARATPGYEGGAWEAILQNTNVYFEGSPVAWYDLDNGFVRYATLWDLAHLKQGVIHPHDMFSSTIEAERERLEEFLNSRLWLLTEKQWDEAEFPPPIEDGPPFVRGVTAGAEAGRMRNMARDHKSNDYPDLEAALLGAQSKFDATHAIARGGNAVIFSPSSRGYTKRVGFREKGFYHWPEKGELVGDLPSNAEMIHTLIDSGWDPEVAPEVEHRRAAEEELLWAVTWLNPKTGKRQIYFDEMPERRARNEAHRLRQRAPDADVRVELAGTRSDEAREVRENPIDTGDGVPWVKIARDPEQYKEAMKEADAIGPIDDPKKVYELLGPALLKEDQECFVVVLLDVRQQCRGVAEVHRGSRSRVSTSLVDILRVVLKSGAEGFVVVHNHPSGKASPSEADKDLTKAISKSADLFDGDLAFVDHVICGNGQYYSFADKKLFHAKSEKREKKRKLKRKAA